MAQVKKVESILKDALLQTYISADGALSNSEDKCAILISAIRQALMYLSK